MCCEACAASQLFATSIVVGELVAVAGAGSPLLVAAVALIAVCAGLRVGVRMWTERSLLSSSRSLDNLRAGVPFDVVGAMCSDDVEGVSADGHCPASFEMSALSGVTRTGVCVFAFSRTLVGGVASLLLSDGAAGCDASLGVARVGVGSVRMSRKLTL